jgi:hypothetical protein
MVYSQAKCLFILEHYFASKSFAAVREAFSSTYPNKEVPNKTIYRLVTIFETQEVSVSYKCLLSDKTAEIAAVQISSSASAATTGYGSRIQYCHWFRSFVFEGVGV